jgi:hypothetical protein
MTSSPFSLGAGGSSDQPANFYDKMVYDTLNYRKKQGAKHEVGVEIEGIIPDAAEVRLLGNRHRQCKYY